MAPYAHLPASVVAALPKLSNKAVRVAVALGVFMDRAGECFPSRERIMQRSGLRRPWSVSRAIGELKDAGILDLQRRPNASTLYRWRGLESAPSALSGKYAKRTAGKYASRTFHNVNMPPYHSHKDSDSSGKMGRRSASRHPLRGLVEEGSASDFAGVGIEVRND